MEGRGPHKRTGTPSGNGQLGYGLVIGNADSELEACSPSKGSVGCNSDRGREIDNAYRSTT
jgi:hypothetical protein